MEAKAHGDDGDRWRSEYGFHRPGRGNDGGMQNMLDVTVDTKVRKRFG
jgi:hypothetical protein